MKRTGFHPSSFVILEMGTRWNACHYPHLSTAHISESWAVDRQASRPKRAWYWPDANGVTHTSPGQRPGFMDQKPSQALKARFIIARQSSRAPNWWRPTLKGEIFEINLAQTLMKQAVGLRRQNNP